MERTRLLAGRYRFLRLLPGRAKGATWMAIDEATGSSVVASVMPSSRASLLLNAVGFKHERLASVVDIVQKPTVDDIPAGCELPKDSWVAVAEWVPGRTLHEHIKESSEGAFEALQCLAQVASVLGSLHARSAVHGALSPRAVLTERMDLGPVPTITQVLVPPDGACFSPERVRGSGPSPHDDLWAFHVMLYMALTRQRPFSGNSAPDLARAITTAKAAPLASYDVGDKELQKLFDRGFGPLEKRCQRVDDLAAELTLWLARNRSQGERKSRSEIQPAVPSQPLSLNTGPFSTAGRDEEAWESTLRRSAGISGTSPAVTLADTSREESRDTSPDAADANAEATHLIVRPELAVGRSSTSEDDLADEEKTALFTTGQFAHDEELKRELLGDLARKPQALAPTSPARSAPRPSAQGTSTARARKSAPEVGPEPAPAAPLSALESQERRPEQPSQGASGEQSNVQAQGPERVPSAERLSAAQPETAPPVQPESQVQESRTEQPPVEPVSPRVQAEITSQTPEPQVIAKQDSVSAHPALEAATSLDPTPAEESRRFFKAPLLLGAAAVGALFAVGTFFWFRGHPDASMMGPGRPNSSSNQAVVTRQESAAPSASQAVEPPVLATATASQASPQLSTSAALASATAQLATSASAPLVSSAAAPSASASSPPVATPSVPPGVSECVAGFFTPDTFLVPQDFSFVCTEPDIRKGGPKMRARIVLGGRGALTKGMDEWPRLGWYELLVWGTLRAACCPGVPVADIQEVEVPCDPLLPSVEKAARAIVAHQREEAELQIAAFEKAAGCMQFQEKRVYRYASPPRSGGQLAFGKFLARALARGN